MHRARCAQGWHVGRLAPRIFLHIQQTAMLITTAPAPAGICVLCHHHPMPSGSGSPCRSHSRRISPSHRAQSALLSEAGVALPQAIAVGAATVADLIVISEYNRDVKQRMLQDAPSATSLPRKCDAHFFDRIEQGADILLYFVQVYEIEISSDISTGVAIGPTLRDIIARPPNERLSSPSGSDCLSSSQSSINDRCRPAKTD